MKKAWKLAPATSFVAGLTAAGLLVAGCKIENTGPHVDRAEQRREKKLDQMITPQTLAPTSQDEAELVLAACGRPSRDVVLPMYSKLEHGPIRMMTFPGRAKVTLVFVPSDPEPHSGRRLMTPPAGRPPLKAELPPNTVWDFEEGVLGAEEFLVPDRLRVYLPCAAKALAGAPDS